MDSMRAFMRGAAAQGDPQRVFDWDKAARLIREQRPNVARAGLGSDWEYTGGTIYQHGAPVKPEDTYVFLSSNWATPELDMDGDVQDCWRYAKDTDGWTSDTFWPESALAILDGRAVAIKETTTVAD